MNGQINNNNYIIRFGNQRIHKVYIQIFALKKCLSSIFVIISISICAQDNAIGQALTYHKYVNLLGYGNIASGSSNHKKDIKTG